ncbi:hypothetical protein PV08_11225 [Exophiala spinifera]|uniref:Helicase ATP-binding domain-containing protein n=1 Tax=Exophiala spinifera TaxID=91928 RepID=A0A0D2AU39_9EURO|nr:uncharacterized protein PV08_11225 [Exophiala spinifera]KIW10263.1 hypothetical protein PV08_11225 [Exophiala spinifera]
MDLLHFNALLKHGVLLDTFAGTAGSLFAEPGLIAPKSGLTPLSPDRARCHFKLSYATELPESELGDASAVRGQITSQLCFQTLVHFVQSPTRILHIQKAIHQQNVPGKSLTALLFSCPGHFGSSRIAYLEFNKSAVRRTVLGSAMSACSLAMRSRKRVGPVQTKAQDQDQEQTGKILAELLRKHSSSPPSSVKLKFKDFRHYMATVAVAEHKLQEQIRQAETKVIESCSLKLMKLENGNDQEFNAFFRTPPGYQGKFQAGDKARVSLCLPGGLDEGWVMRVIEPPHFARAGEITAVLSPGRAWSGNDQIKIITPPGPHVTGGRALRWILEQKGNPAVIIPEFRHSLWYYITGASEALFERSRKPNQDPSERAVLDFLVGNFENLPKWNIYSPLHDKSLATPTLMNLNDGQKQAIEMAKNAPGGFLICHGGPGTGKTHFIVEAVTPFLNDSAKEHKLLLTAATNRGVDSMASELSDRLRLLSKDDPSLASRYILRVHSYKTEKAIVMRHAEKSRRQNLSKKPASSAKPTAGQASERTDPPGSITAHCTTFSSSKFELIDDHRVQNINLSVGHKVLELHDLISSTSTPEPDFSSSSGRNDKFVRLYTRYSRGEWFPSDVNAKLEEALDEVLGAVVQGATALCATVGGAAEYNISRHYSNAELIVMDEAARMPEFETWPLFAFYPKAVGKIMVGDPDQLGPHIDEFEELEPYHEQLSMSLQERCQKAGFESAFFTVQYRATPQIADIYNGACYENRLSHDETTSIDHPKRILADAVKRHNEQTYGCDNSVVFFDTPSAEDTQAYGTSKACEQYAARVINVLENLLSAGFGSDANPCTIAILTPYTGQFKVLSLAKDNMQKRYPAVQNVIIETIGKCQGMQYDIVIADPVLVGAIPRFLTKNRLNVLLSRARHGLYVVGNYNKWISMKWVEAGPLKAFAKELWQYRAPATVPVPKRSPFIDSGVFWTRDDD